MQLPHIVASAGLAQPSVPLRSIAAAEAPWRGVEELGGTISAIAEKRLAIERQKQHYEADTEAHYISSQMELEMATGLNALQRTEQDPAIYKAKAQDLIRTTMESLPSRSDKPFVQQYLQRHMAPIIGRHQLQTLHVADAMFVDRQKALGSQTEDNYANIIAQTPWNDHDAIQEIGNRARDAIMAQVGVYGTKATQDRLQAFGYRINREVFQRHLHDAPDDALEKIDSYALKPEDRNVLTARAESRSLHLQALQDRHEKRLEHAMDLERTDTFARLGELAIGTTPGTAGISETEMRADPSWNLLHEGQREHLINLVRDPKQEPSDRQSVEYVVNHLGDRPTITEDEIKRMPGLNSKDRLHYMTAVRERQDYWRGDKHRTEERDLADLHRRQTEVNTLSIGALTLNGQLVTILDDKQQKYQALYREAMLKRSKGTGRALPGFPRNEEPETIYQDVLPPLIRALRGDTDKLYQRLSREITTSPYPTPEALFRKYPGDPGQYATVKEYVDAIKRFRDRDQAKANYEALAAELERVGVKP